MAGWWRSWWRWLQAVRRASGSSFEVNLQPDQEAGDHAVVADGGDQLDHLARAQLPLRGLKRGVVDARVLRQLLGQGQNGALALVELAMAPVLDSVQGGLGKALFEGDATVSAPLVLSASGPRDEANGQLAGGIVQLR